METIKTISVVDLIKKKEALTTTFANIKEQIDLIDTEMEKFRTMKLSKQNELYRLQGEHRLLESLIPKEEKVIPQVVEKKLEN